MGRDESRDPFIKPMKGKDQYSILRLEIKKIFKFVDGFLAVLAVIETYGFSVSALITKRKCGKTFYEKRKC